MAGFSIIGYSSQMDDEILHLMDRAIRISCAGDYSAEALSAWSPAGRPEASRRLIAKLRASETLLLVEDGCLSGFGNAWSHEIDCLYVDPDRQGMGYGKALLARLEMIAAPDMHLYSSDTALGFFLSQGWAYSGENRVERDGIILRNHLLRKSRPW